MCSGFVLSTQRQCKGFSLNSLTRVGLEKSSCFRVLHYIDVSSPSVFVVPLLSKVIANAALKHPSGKASVNYGTILDNFCRLPCVSYDKGIYSK